MKTNLGCEVSKVQKHWDFSEFDALIDLHGQDLFQFALQLSIHDLAPNELDSYTKDRLVSRLHNYYSNVPALQGLQLEHDLGL